MTLLSREGDATAVRGLEDNATWNDCTGTTQATVSLLSSGKWHRPCPCPTALSNAVFFLLMKSTATSRPYKNIPLGI